MKDNLKIIQELHKTDFKFVIVSSGGGSNAVGTLLKVPGASNSVLEAYIPYAKESLDFYLLRKPDFYCSIDTTLRMAARAYSAAKKIDPNSDVSKLFGWQLQQHYQQLMKKEESTDSILPYKLKHIQKVFHVF